MNFIWMHFQVILSYIKYKIPKVLDFRLRARRLTGLVTQIKWGKYFVTSIVEWNYIQVE